MPTFCFYCIKFSTDSNRKINKLIKNDRQNKIQPGDAVRISIRVPRQRVHCQLHTNLHGAAVVPGEDKRLQEGDQPAQLLTLDTFVSAICCLDI